MSELVGKISKLAERTKALLALAPNCPGCKSPETLLVEYIFTKPARWKCRACKTHFERDLPGDK